ncbi:class I SAM-dependent methyltransferase [Ramlibacter sp. AN1133]|uniref:class I SAM-dependent methyltransferase n=1 Tax=Ramlibacter sp. AN1133 TaxID=3133429 RepID=UPI0030BAFC4F
MSTLKKLADLSSAVASYWTDHNVTLHKVFASRAESVEYFHWRCDQYPGYLDLMPVAGFDGQDILDYGCGPGHDLVGFLEYSKPRRVVGVDVSRSSLAEATHRLKLHGGERVELLLARPDQTALPFEDASFDYIHSSGVLHHVPDLRASLRELRRLLRPGGRMRVMVYNHDSLWMHLYVAHTLRLRNKTIPADLPIRQAFTRSTDGPDCPIANCYTGAEFAAEAAAAGLACRTVGAAVSLHELHQLQQFRLEACMDLALEREHREFLLALTFDHRGTPLWNGLPAGVDLVLELQPA